MQRTILAVIGVLMLVQAVSALGGNWKEINASAEFPARYQHSSVVYDTKIWVIGGQDAGYKNDVWYSSDGNLWYKAIATAGFPARNWHTSVNYTDRMWVIGGVSDGNLMNDVWYSTDGVTWTRATASAAFPVRQAHVSVVYNNKMWVIGGTGAGGVSRNDVWHSTDGITWTQANANAGFSARFGHTSLDFGGKMWVIGGDDGANKNDVWHSTDGVTWTQATAAAAFPARYSHTSIVYDDKMWVIGGMSGSPVNDIWYSTDGVTWIQVTTTNAPPAREGHTSLVFGSKMWIIGGFDGSTNKNDVWASLISPVAGFTASPTSGYAPLSVAFTDSSTEFPSSFSWVFGDGGTSTNANPAHTYTAAGTYTVSQTVTNNEGTSTETKTQYVTVTVQDYFTGGDDPPSPEPSTIHASMTTTVNVGGNSAVTRVAVTGTGLSELIMTGTVQPTPGSGITPPPGIVYQYVDLVPARYITITGSEISFTIPLSWFEEYYISPENTVMYHYTGTVWKSLPTKMQKTENGMVHFLGQSSGFSLFAIAGERRESPNMTEHSQSQQTSGDLLPLLENTRAPKNPAGTQTTTPVPAQTIQPATTSPLTAIILVVAGCAVLLTSCFLIRRWWIIRQNPALFRKDR